MSSRRSQASVLRKSVSPLPLMPALLTRTSSLPKRPTTCSTAAIQEFSSDTFQVDEHGFTAGLGYFGLDALSVLLSDVGDGNPCALAGEQAAFLGAHAVGAAGYHCDFTFQSHIPPGRILRAGGAVRANSSFCAGQLPVRARILQMSLISQYRK